MDLLHLDPHVQVAEEPGNRHAREDELPYRHSYFARGHDLDLSYIQKR